MKILAYMENPTIQTGSAQVSKHLLPVFAELGHTVEIVPINMASDHEYDKQKWPYVFYPCQGGDMNQMFNAENAKKHILEDEYDVLFLTADINRIQDVWGAVERAQQLGKAFKTIVYAAIDCDLIKPDFLKCLWLADVSIVYSQYAYDIAVRNIPALERKLQVIYHGCEPDVFYPLPQERRSEIRRNTFRITDSTFLVINVNRNQMRKDLARTMYAFHLFREKHPDSLLYLHAKQQDQGGNLLQQATLLGIDISTEIIFTPPTHSEYTGVSRNRLNHIYNAADVAMSTAMGEGWGLTTTECMAAGTPFIGPNNTVFPEILGNGERGYLVESGGPDLWMIPYTLSDGPRDMTSVTGMVAALEHVYHHRKEAKVKAKAAQQWAQEHTWQHVQAQWKQTLSSMKVDTIASSAPVTA